MWGGGQQQQNDKTERKRLTHTFIMMQTFNKASEPILGDISFFWNRANELDASCWALLPISKTATMLR